MITTNVHKQLRLRRGKTTQVVAVVIVSVYDTFFGKTKTDYWHCCVVMRENIRGGSVFLQTGFSFRVSEKILADFYSIPNSPELTVTSILITWLFLTFLQMKISKSKHVQSIFRPEFRIGPLPKLHINGFKLRIFVFQSESRSYAFPLYIATFLSFNFLAKNTNLILITALGNIQLTNYRR